ncbi:MAG: Hsp20/alpha crystallin family protein [Candidatus Korobacteraceae bacterium]|jgi:HSP20 family protein
MTLLTRWEPFREMASLQNRMGRLLNEWNEPFSSLTGDESLNAGSFVPPVDVYEDEHGIQLKMEVPGIDEKDIDIRLENNVLTVTGERKIENEEKQENFHRVERRYGTFSRSFTLPNTVDNESVTASYDKGLLKISLGKRADAKPRQIKVNIGKELSATAK